MDVIQDVYGGSLPAEYFPGAVTVTAGLSLLVWALIRSDTAGWAASEVIGGLAAAAVCWAPS